MKTLTAKRQAARTRRDGRSSSAEHKGRPIARPARRQSKRSVKTRRAKLLKPKPSVARRKNANAASRNSKRSVSRKPPTAKRAKIQKKEPVKRPNKKLVRALQTRPR